MKVFTALLLSMSLIAGVVVLADAQTSPPTSPSPSAPGSTPAPESRPGPSTGSPGVGADQPRTGPDVNVDVRTRRDDTAAASPRTSTETTRIFGLSPTMAILIAAALFVVVILALVSMTRNGGARTDTHLDVDRRP